jgi:hydrogenase nickel incorporation protein HypB
MREIDEGILAQELERAETNYHLLKESGVQAISVMGTTGSGKTLLIERIIDRIAPCGLAIATIAGDAVGDEDHRRFLAHGVISVSLNGETPSYLEPQEVNEALASLPLAEIDLLFIENVGGLVVPAEHPLGAKIDVVIVSVTEGEATIRKHPAIFAQTDILVINKIDLVAAIGVDVQRIVEDYSRRNPHGRAILTDAQHHRGIDDLLQALGIECATAQW